MLISTANHCLLLLILEERNVNSRLSNIRPDIIANALAKETVDWTLFAGDQMLRPGSHLHYRDVGESATRCIYGALLMANVDSPGSILDFGSGSGRVTRWLRACFPDADLSASEIIDESLEFLAKQFKAETWKSSPDVFGLTAPKKYDLIWAGSVLTHLSEQKTITLMQKFRDWLNPGGVAVVTTHGKRMIENVRNRAFQYMDRELEEQFLTDYKARGYAYANYRGEQYGVSANTISWVTDAVEAMNCRIITISEHAWDQHQDVVAFQAPRLPTSDIPLVTVISRTPKKRAP
jgi:trans-aconitate methyltransferase